MADIQARLLELALGKQVPADEPGVLKAAFDLEFAFRRPDEAGPSSKDLARKALGMRAADDFDPKYWRMQCALAGEFSSQLQDLASDKRDARKRLVPWVKGIPLGIQLVPSYVVDGSKLQTRYLVFAEELSGFFRYALGLLLDENRAYGSLLSQCRLPECGRFFLAEIGPLGGRPRRLYCIEDHMYVAHNRDAAARVARHRRKHK